MALRRCKWCRRMYDPDKGSSIFCEKNPHRLSGYSKWKRRRGNRGKVYITTVVMGPNIWANSYDHRGDGASTRKAGRARNGRFVQSREARDKVSSGATT
jgi:hypothetical protein